MTRVTLTTFSALALGLLISVGVAPAAHAATLDIDYTLDTTDPMHGAANVFCNPWPDPNFHYEMKPVTVTVDGSYAFTTSAGGYFIVYSQPFDPSDPVAGCMGGSDTIVTVSLTTSNTYWLYLSSALPNVVGDFRLTVDGPGDIRAQAHSQIALDVDPVSATEGTPVTLTAQITGVSPTGGVEFFADGASIGVAPLSGGVATLTVTPLSPAVVAITAVYGGDSLNLPSTSAAANLTVTAAPIPEPEPEPEPQLAATGADGIQPALGALALLMSGITLTAIRRRVTH